MKKNRLFILKILPIIIIILFFIGCYPSTPKDVVKEYFKERGNNHSCEHLFIDWNSKNQYFDLTRGLFDNNKIESISQISQNNNEIITIKLKHTRRGFSECIFTISRYENKWKIIHIQRQ